MSFYLTLPSNSSSLYYPDNSQSNYTTQLAKELNNLDGYEVALVEMNYAPYFATDLGVIQVNGEFFKSIYNIRNDTLEIQISIFSTTDIVQLCEQMNNELIRNLIYYDFAYRSYIISNKVEKNIVIKHFEYNKIAKQNQIFELEIYKCLTAGSPYYFIDSEDSVFKEDFINVSKQPNCEITFSSSQQKWICNANAIKNLNKKFKLKILFTPGSFESSKEKFNVNFVSKILNETKLVDRNDSYNIKSDLGLNADIFELPNIIYIEKNSTGSFLSKQLFDLPTFKCGNETFNNHNQVELNYDSKILNDDLIIVSNKLANMFFGNDKGIIKRNKAYLVDSSVSPLNYALVYTDIIENQIFGDVIKPILKIIPIKSYNDSEVVTFFDNLHYVKLSKDSISTINIQIRDLFGEQIKFQNKFSFVIVKLHFRKIKNE